MGCLNIQENLVSDLFLADDGRFCGDFPPFCILAPRIQTCQLFYCIDWCCFYYFLRNSLVALLEALFARPKDCIFWGTSFKFIKNLATLDPEKLQAFYGTLLYHCYTLVNDAIQGQMGLQHDCWYLNWVRILGRTWAKSRNSGGFFPTYFSTLKVQRHQSKAPGQVSKHAYVAALKRCDWFFVEVILFNNVARVNVVKQIPTGFCSTTFSNNNYTCDPMSIWILYQNHSSLYQHIYWNCCLVKHTNLKHLYVETL